MAATTIRSSILLLLALWTVSTTAQIIDNLPACWQTCISQSGNLNCSPTDIKCICRASNGNFLPDVVTCARGNCDNALDANLLLTPLQLACVLLGAPISPAAIRNAENAAAATSAAASVTVTTTVGAASSSSDSISIRTTTVSAALSPSTTASDITVGASTYAAIYATSRIITTTTTDAKGDVYVLMLPTATTVTHITVIHPATGSGFVSSGSGAASSGGGAMATSTAGVSSLIMTVDGGAASTRDGPGGSCTVNPAAQETNGAPLDYECSAGSVMNWDRWLWIAAAAVVLACLL